MATAEELLAATGETSDTITLDLDSRRMAIPEAAVTIGVASDDDVKRLYFVVPRHYREIDLSEFDIRINFKNGAGTEDQYPIPAANIEVDEDTDQINFSWLLDRSVFEKAGDVKFSICMVKYGAEGIIEKEFNSTPAILKVLEGLETVEAIVENNPSAFDNVLFRLKAVENAMGLGVTGYYNIIDVKMEDEVPTMTIASHDGEIQYTITDGVDGYTPVKGVDYYTEEEKNALETDIVNDVTAYVDTWAPDTHVVALLRTEWINNQQIVSIEDVTEDNLVFVSPELSDDNSNIYINAGIRCISQTAGQLTFSCDKVPVDDVAVNVCVYHNTSLSGDTTIDSDSALYKIVGSAVGAYMEENPVSTLYYVTPEMYGAVADGITDDTAAVQAAIDTNRPVLLAEEYKIMDLNLHANSTVTVNGTLHVHGKINVNYPDIVFSGNGMIKSYGAVCFELKGAGNDWNSYCKMFHISEELTVRGVGGEGTAFLITADKDYDGIVVYPDINCRIQTFLYGIHSVFDGNNGSWFTSLRCRALFENCRYAIIFDWMGGGSTIDSTFQPVLTDSPHTDTIPLIRVNSNCIINGMIWDFGQAVNKYAIETLGDYNKINIPIKESFMSVKNIDMASIRPYRTPPFNVSTQFWGIDTADKDTRVPVLMPYDNTNDFARNAGNNTVKLTVNPSVYTYGIKNLLSGKTDQQFISPSVADKLELTFEFDESIALRTIFVGGHPLPDQVQFEYKNSNGEWCILKTCNKDNDYFHRPGYESYAWWQHVYRQYDDITMESRYAYGVRITMSTASNYIIDRVYIGATHVNTLVKTGDDVIATSLKLKGNDGKYYNMLPHTVGSDARPVYFVNGEPFEIEYDLKEFDSILDVHRTVTDELIVHHGLDSNSPLSASSDITCNQTGSGDADPGNIRPINGWSNVTLYQTGKNVIPADSDLTIAGYYDVPCYIPAGTYTWSCSGYESEGEEFPVIVPVGENGNVLSSAVFMVVWEHRTVTLSEPTYAIRYYSNGWSYETSQGVTSKLYNLQLEKGSTYTPYEPYQSNTFSAVFEQTVYGGNFNWNTGVLTIDKGAVTFDGTEEWRAQEDGLIICASAINDRKLYSDTFTGLTCDRYLADSSATKYCCWNATNGEYFGIRDDSITTDSLVSSLQATPMTICYDLEEPITIQLDSQEPVALTGTNCFFSTTGQTTVKQINVKVDKTLTKSGYAADAKIMGDRLAQLEQILKAAGLME